MMLKPQKQVARVFAVKGNHSDSMFLAFCLNVLRLEIIDPLNFIISK